MLKSHKEIETAGSRQATDHPTKPAISSKGCGPVISPTHALDSDDRPMRRP
jgi:hypothetical protein